MCRYPLRCYIVIRGQIKLGIGIIWLMVLGNAPIRSAISVMTEITVRSKFQFAYRKMHLKVQSLIEIPQNSVFSLGTKKKEEPGGMLCFFRLHQQPFDCQPLQQYLLIRLQIPIVGSCQGRQSRSTIAKETNYGKLQKGTNLLYTICWMVMDRHHLHFIVFHIFLPSFV